MAVIDPLQNELLNILYLKKFSSDFHTVHEIDILCSFTTRGQIEKKKTSNFRNFKGTFHREIKEITKSPWLYYKNFFFQFSSHTSVKTWVVKPNSHTSITRTARNFRFVKFSWAFGREKKKKWSDESAFPVISSSHCWLTSRTNLFRFIGKLIKSFCAGARVTPKFGEPRARFASFRNAATLLVIENWLAIFDPCLFPMFARGRNDLARI